MNKKVSLERFVDILKTIEKQKVYYLYDYKGDRELYNEVYSHYSTIIEDKKISNYLFKAKCGDFEKGLNVSIYDLNTYFEAYMVNQTVLEAELDFILILLMWLGNKKLVEL